MDHCASNLELCWEKIQTLIAKMAIDYNSMELAKAQLRYNLIFLPISQNFPYPNASPS